MSTTEEVLAVLPTLSEEERAQVARALEELATKGAADETAPVAPQPICGLHEGASTIHGDFNDPSLDITEEVPPVLPPWSDEERARVARLLDERDAKVAAAQATGGPMPPRIAGLHEGAWWVAEDAFDPMPDEFWLGEDA